LDEGDPVTMSESMDGSRWFGAAALTGALGFTAYVLGGLVTAWLAEPLPEAGERAPAFAAAGLDGRPVRLSDHRGQAVLLDFWTTTCVGCIGSLNRLARFQDDYGDRGFQVLSLNQDPTDLKPEVRAVVKERGLSFPVAIGPESHAAAEAYRIRGFPTVVLIDPGGRVRAVHAGAVAESRLRRQIEAMLPAG
jgi:peroxiredoxin